MNAKEFSSAAREMIDYIVDYHDNIRSRRPLAAVQPGYLRSLLPSSAPDLPQTFEEVMADVERVIQPGMTHWTSPQFHAYFPSCSSFPSMLADMLCGALTCIGFTWEASPACTELEVVMMDWLAKLLGLPEHFLATAPGSGGGVIQGSASEATLVALLAAKQRALRSCTTVQQKAQQTLLLVAYASEMSHSSVERAGMLVGVQLRLLPADPHHALRGSVLRAAMEEDCQRGLLPFAVVVTLGTTSTCAFDNLREIGDVCYSFPDVWIHVDAAYAGASFVCEELRAPMEGIEVVDSFNFNPHKWLLVNFDCSAMWIRKSEEVVDAFHVDPVYLRHQHQTDPMAPDYRHWQLPLGRRFRSLKLWFVMRMYGKAGLQDHIRKHVALARQFEQLVRADSRFEIICPVRLGLVCFRVKVSKYDLNAFNARLVKRINEDGAIHLVASEVAGVYFLRLAVCSRFTESEDMVFAWKAVERLTSQLLKEEDK
ncbi:Pyridoxal phosphate-dependent decarboxylase [Trinorchestia longiramus]|nr:Pyridoxal phosphate-dependent decarboxylase [Trinorchestia longiramus]